MTKNAPPKHATAPATKHSAPPAAKCSTTPGPNTQHPQSQHTQHPQPQNNQNSQLFDVPNRYAEQIKLRKEWEERIEMLNEKYKLDYYSSSESDSDPEPDYRHEHKYETSSTNNFYPLNYWKNQSYR